MRSLKPGGRIVISGATSGHAPSADLQRLFFLQLSVIGSTMGTRAELGRLLHFFEQTGARPLIHTRMPLTEAREGFAALALGEQFGKIVFTADPSPRPFPDSAGAEPAVDNVARAHRAARPACALHRDCAPERKCQAPAGARGCAAPPGPARVPSLRQPRPLSPGCPSRARSCAPVPGRGPAAVGRALLAAGRRRAPGHARAPRPRISLRTRSSVSSRISSVRSARPRRPPRPIARPAGPGPGRSP